MLQFILQLFFPLCVYSSIRAVGGAVGLTAEAHSPRGLWAGWWTAGPGETETTAGL